MNRRPSLFRVLADGLARALSFTASGPERHGGPLDPRDEHRPPAVLADEATLYDLDRLQRERELQIMMAGWM